MALVLLALLLVVLPTPASAGRRTGAAGGGHRGGVVHVRPRPLVAPPSVFPTTINPWLFWGVSTIPRHGFARHRFPIVGAVPVIGGGVYASTIYAVPSYAAPSLGYDSALAVATPAAVLAAPLPSAPPVPPLIEYPTGWYQLRGDGLNSPYVWVWIPKPPPAPLEAPPAPPPAAPSPPDKEGAEHPRGQLFRWVDEQDVIHWTDRLERVPSRYRAGVERVS